MTTTTATDDPDIFHSPVDFTSSLMERSREEEIEDPLDRALPFGSVEEAHSKFVSSRFPSDFWARAQKTVWTLRAAVEDEKSEDTFHQMALLFLCGRLNERNGIQCVHGGLASIDRVWMEPESMTPRGVTMEWTVESLLQHLRQRMYSPRGPTLKRPRFAMYMLNDRVYPCLASLVAHIVAQQSSQWDGTVEVASELLRSSFEMDPTNIRAGLALYGLQALKLGSPIPAGLSVHVVLDLLRSQGVYESLEKASGLPRESLALYTVEILMNYARDFCDNDEYSRAIRAIVGVMKHQHLRSVSVDLTTMEESVDVPERNRILSIRFRIQTRVRVFLAEDSVSNATMLIKAVADKSALPEDDIYDLWCDVLEYLRQSGQLLLDGNVDHHYHEKRSLHIDIVQKMDRIGLEAIEDYYTNFCDKVRQSPLINQEEVKYLVLAAQHTIVKLLVIKIPNEDKAITRALEVLRIGLTYGSKQAWAHGFLQRKNPVPQSLMLGGVIDLADFNKREEKKPDPPQVIAHAPVGAIEQEEEEQQQQQKNDSHDDEVEVLEIEDDEEDEEVAVLAPKQVHLKGCNDEEVVVEGEGEEEEKEDVVHQPDVLEIDDDEETEAKEEVSKHEVEEDEDEKEGEEEDEEEEDDDDDEEEEEEEIPKVEPPQVAAAKDDVVEILDSDDDEEEVEPTIEDSEEQDEDEQDDHDEGEENENEDEDDVEDTDNRTVEAVDSDDKMDVDSVDREEEDHEEEREETEGESMEVEELSPAEAMPPPKVRPTAEEFERLEKGYEPDTAGQTEEEVSEAVPTEEEDNAEEDRPATLSTQKSSTQGVEENLLQPNMQSLRASFSDDMDAADEHTAEEDIAESSEHDEGGSVLQPAVQSVPQEEAPSTLIRFAYSAQRQSSMDQDEVFATDISRTDERVDDTEAEEEVEVVAMKQVEESTTEESGAPEAQAGTKTDALAGTKQQTENETTQQGSDKNTPAVKLAERAKPLLAETSQSVESSSETVESPMEQTKAKVKKLFDMLVKHGLDHNTAAAKAIVFVGRRHELRNRKPLKTSAKPKVAIKPEPAVLREKPEEQHVDSERTTPVDTLKPGIVDTIPLMERTPDDRPTLMRDLSTRAHVTDMSYTDLLEADESLDAFDGKKSVSDEAAETETTPANLDDAKRTIDFSPPAKSLSERGDDNNLVDKEGKEEGYQEVTEKAMPAEKEEVEGDVEEAKFEQTQALIVVHTEDESSEQHTEKPSEQMDEIADEEKANEREVNDVGEADASMEEAVEGIEEGKEQPIQADEMDQADTKEAKGQDALEVEEVDTPMEQDMVSIEEQKEQAEEEADEAEAVNEQGVDEVEDVGQAVERAVELALEQAAREKHESDVIASLKGADVVDRVPRRPGALERNASTMVLVGDAASRDDTEEDDEDQLPAKEEVTAPRETMNSTDRVKEPLDTNEATKECADDEQTKESRKEVTDLVEKAQEETKVLAKTGDAKVPSEQVEETGQVADTAHPEEQEGIPKEVVEAEEIQSKTTVSNSRRARFVSTPADPESEQVVEAKDASPVVQVDTKEKAEPLDGTMEIGPVDPPGTSSVAVEDEPRSTAEDESAEMAEEVPPSTEIGPVDPDGKTIEVDDQTEVKAVAPPADASNRHGGNWSRESFEYFRPSRRRRSREKEADDRAEGGDEMHNTMTAETEGNQLTQFSRRRSRKRKAMEGSGDSAALRTCSHDNQNDTKRGEEDEKGNENKESPGTKKKRSRKSASVDTVARPEQREPRGRNKDMSKDAEDAEEYEEIDDEQVSPSQSKQTPTKKSETADPVARRTRSKDHRKDIQDIHGDDEQDDEGEEHHEDNHSTPERSTRNTRRSRRRKSNDSVALHTRSHDVSPAQHTRSHDKHMITDGDVYMYEKLRSPRRRTSSGSSRTPRKRRKSPKEQENRPIPHDGSEVSVELSPPRESIEIDDSDVDLTGNDLVVSVDGAKTEGRQQPPPPLPKSEPEEVSDNESVAARVGRRRRSRASRSDEEESDESSVSTEQSQPRRRTRAKKPNLEPIEENKPVTRLTRSSRKRTEETDDDDDDTIASVATSTRSSTRKRAAKSQEPRVELSGMEKLREFNEEDEGDEGKPPPKKRASRRKAKKDAPPPARRSTRRRKDDESVSTTSMSLRSRARRSSRK